MRGALALVAACAVHWRRRPGRPRWPASLVAPALAQLRLVVVTVIVPIPITLRPRALTAWHFADVSQGPEFAALTRGEWQPDKPVPGVWFGFPTHNRRLTVGDYLVRDAAANFRVVSSPGFELDYDTVVPQHPASLLAHVRALLAAEFDEPEDVVAALRRLLAVRHSSDPCGHCRHPRFSHQGLHGKYGPCALCDQSGVGCADYVERIDEP